MVDRAGVNTDVLFPLNRFYETGSMALPATVIMPGSSLPEPYRGILDHDRDMTPTLEAFFRDGITIEIIHRGQNDDAYTREVVLRTVSGQKSVAYGSIDIHLGEFQDGPREDILSGRFPFGTVLSRHGIPHVSAPIGFFEIASDSQTAKHFELTQPARLYGRRNRLSTPDGRTLADVLEILAPIFGNPKVMKDGIIIKEGKA